MKAVNNYFIAEPIFDDSSIVFSEVRPEDTRWGKIVSVGPGVPDWDGSMVVPQIEEGEIVYTMLHGKLDVTHDGRKLYAASELDVLAKLVSTDPPEIQPLGNFVQIQKIDPNEGGGFTVGPTEAGVCLGRVIKLGTGWRTVNGKSIPFHVKEGDIVIYNPGKTMVVDFSALGLDHVTHIVNHSDIIAIL